MIPDHCPAGVFPASCSELALATKTPQCAAEEDSRLHFPAVHSRAHFILYIYVHLVQTSRQRDDKPSLLLIPVQPRMLHRRRQMIRVHRGQYQGEEYAHDDKEDACTRGLPGLWFEKDVHVEDE